MVRRLAEGALAQVTEEDWFREPGPQENSLAVQVKHLAGNMRSRWTDFLTTDGEKPDRHRDREFELGPGDTQASLRERWEEGWRLLFAAVEPLREEDLERTVTIRGEPHAVLQALNRQVAHYAYHVGQIVFWARHLVGPGWVSLSIPRGRSDTFEVSRDGEPYAPEAERPAS
jgi:uncharacterized damage-inducible protein DinB